VKKQVQQALDEEELRELASRVGRALTPDLLKPEYRKTYDPSNPMRGHCFTATETLFHLGGGKAAGLKPVNVQHEGDSHWFLTDAAGNVYDVTASQFSTPRAVRASEGQGYAGQVPARTEYAQRETHRARERDKAMKSQVKEALDAEFAKRLHGLQVHEDTEHYNWGAKQFVLKDGEQIVGTLRAHGPENLRMVYEPCRRGYQQLLNVHPEIQGLYTVKYSYVDRDLRGHGAGAQLYRHALEDLGRQHFALQPDECTRGGETSEAAQMVWSALKVEYPHDGDVVYGGGRS
jgi:predicted GNAT family acetyltransferase